MGVHRPLNGKKGKTMKTTERNANHELERQMVYAIIVEAAKEATRKDYVYNPKDPCDPIRFLKSWSDVPVVAQTLHAIRKNPEAVRKSLENSEHLMLVNINNEKEA